MTENDNLDYLNKYMIPKFFDIKSIKLLMRHYTIRAMVQN